MDAMMQMTIERSCERLCTDYARWADARSDRFAELFTDDGSLTLVNVACRGMPQILAFIRKRRAEGLLTRHLCSNVAIDVASPTSATGTVDCLYFAGRPADSMVCRSVLAPQAIGTYTDRYSLTASGWRIAERHYRMVFFRVAPAAGS